MTQKTFQVVALPTAVADEARRRAREGASDHRTSVVEVEHAAPCRHCLSWAKPGERVILFPFQAIASGQPYAESGPIFVHAESCPRYSAPDEWPPELRSGRVVRAYNDRSEIVAAEAVNGAPEEVAARLLKDDAVRFLHVRSATHGCYTFGLERA